MIRKNQQFLSQMYLIVDFCIVQLAFLLSWWVKFESGWFEYIRPLPLNYYALWSLGYGVCIVLAGLVSGLYAFQRKKRFSEELLKIFQTHAIGFFVLLSAMYFLKEINISRSYLFLYLFFSILLVVAYRYVLKVVLRKFRQRGYNKQFLLIIGAGTLGRRFYSNLLMHPELGYEVVGFLDDQVKSVSSDSASPPILGSVEDLEEVLNHTVIDEVILALPLQANDKYAQIIGRCEKAGVRALIIPDYFDFLPARPVFDTFAGMPLINVRDVPLDLIFNKTCKRIFDILFALFCIVLTSPIMIAVALGVRLSSPGPIIFKQERVGLNRRNFNMYKFRSMKLMPPGTVDTGWTTENDPRKTKFGAFIRKTSLDELPQFFNVLFGQMSVVGPRPERPYYVERFKEEIPKYMVKHHVRPGITGFAQSRGLRGDTSIEERIKCDIFYIENWSILFDIKIIFMTIYKGFINKNAY
ncbi:undecaprenyl-phosphate glucose phosphotransferase [Saccharibacillus sp. O16]|nr:undecaprenyl-phosphate glucose phosphotransferase [Saccharibacillus sp. O16]